AHRRAVHRRGHRRIGSLNGWAAGTTSSPDASTRSTPSAAAAPSARSTAAVRRSRSTTVARSCRSPRTTTSASPSTNGSGPPRTEVAVARHCAVDHIRELLAGHHGPTLVVTDSVFSMDGDVAPLVDIAAVCVEHGALLVVDEAHAVLGPDTPTLDGLERVRIG